jgi:hypothetical protein
VEVVDEAEDGPVEIRFEPEGSGFTVWSGEAVLAAVSGREDRGAFAINVGREGRCDREVAARILAGVEAIAAPGALLDMGNPVLRDEARRRGYPGARRAPLTIGPQPVVGARRDTTAAGRGGGTAPPRGGRPAAGGGAGAAAAAAIGALIGRAVSAEPWVENRRLFNLLRVGYGGAVRLTVADSDLTVTIPDSPDLMVESAARAVDTVLAVRDRFGADAEHLRTVSFDRETHTGGHPRWAGQANHTVFSIHLNDSLVLADGWVRLRRHRETTPSRRPPATARHPFTTIDGVAAHEAWHQIEFKFRGRLAEHSAFRRELGAVLGVETLEQAIQGGHRSAPEAFRRAHVRLIETVSAYAATNPLEAGAEMFEVWWCGAPNPTIDCFGRLLDRFFGIGPR